MTSSLVHNSSFGMQTGHAPGGGEWVPDDNELFFKLHGNLNQRRERHDEAPVLSAGS